MQKKESKITIHSIAKMANVSPGTVSRVLSGKEGVGVETRTRIQTLIESLNFQPNLSAQRLGSRRSWSIGLVFSQTTSAAAAQPIFPEMIGAISDYLDEKNYSLTLLSKARHPAESVIQALSQGKVDGVILPDVCADDPIVNQLSAAAIPFVVIGQRFMNPEVSWIDTNHAELIEELTDLLIRKGHKRIAFINGSEEFSASLLRARGFQAAMGKAGLPVHPNFIRSEEFSFQTGYANGKLLLLLPAGERPTAIVAASDLIAAGCLKAAKEHNLQVPAELAITGFDDNPLAQYTQPTLTTARAPIQEMGRAAALQILSLLDRPSQSPGVAHRHTILPGQTVLRESSG